MKRKDVSIKDASITFLNLVTILYNTPKYPRDLYKKKPDRTTSLMVFLSTDNRCGRESDH